MIDFKLIANEPLPEGHMAESHEPRKPFDLQWRNVHFGWLALVLCVIVGVALALNGFEKFAATLVVLGGVVFGITQRNRLENKTPAQGLFSGLAKLFVTPGDKP